MNRSRLPIHEWNEYMSQQVGLDSQNIPSPADGYYMDAESYYADEIPPFDITINFANEYGQRALLRIYGVELLNEGMGLSIDDISTEKALTFVAREIGHMQSLTRP